jgi:hypothetical protein
MAISLLLTLVVADIHQPQQHGLVRMVPELSAPVASVCLPAVSSLLMQIQLQVEQ